MSNKINSTNPTLPTLYVPEEFESTVHHALVHYQDYLKALFRTETNPESQEFISNRISEIQFLRTQTGYETKY